MPVLTNPFMVQAAGGSPTVPDPPTITDAHSYVSGYDYDLEQDIWSTVVTYTNGATGGSPITTHKYYLSGSLAYTYTDASPITFWGSDFAGNPLKMTSVNAIGESAFSNEVVPYSI